LRRHCDDQSRTVTVVKIKDSNEILGGYNPIAWESNILGSYSITINRFIFSFENENHVLSRVINEKRAIRNHSFCGPIFGDGDLDLSNSGNSMCKRTSYDKSIRKTKNKFFIEELEVFQIIKN
jgi:hypothetical protein